MSLKFSTSCGSLIEAGARETRTVKSPAACGTTAPLV